MKKVCLFATALLTASALVTASAPALAQRAAGASRGAQRAAPSAAPSAARGAQVLRLNYTAGQRIHYNMNTTQTVPGGGNVTQDLGVDLETVSVAANGDASQRYRITSVAVNAPGIPASVQQRISQQLVGLAIDYTQSPSGRISNQGTASNVAPQLQAIISSALQTLNQFSPQLPSRAVAVGDSWDDTRTLNSQVGPGMNVSINLAVHYTLRSLENGQATIDLRMTMTVPPGSAIQGVTFTGQGTATGSLALDLNRGFARNISSRGTMNLNAVQGTQNRQISTEFSNQMTAQNPPAAGAAAAPSAAAAARP